MLLCKFISHCEFCLAAYYFKTCPSFDQLLLQTNTPTCAKILAHGGMIHHNILCHLKKTGKLFSFMKQLLLGYTLIWCIILWIDACPSYRSVTLQYERSWLVECAIPVSEIYMNDGKKNILNDFDQFL